MVFSSVVFLFAFLPITFVVYYCLRGPARNYWLLLASIVFYSWGEPKWVFLLLVSTAVNYLFGLLLDPKRRRGRKLLLLLAILWNLGILIYFKYSVFFAETLYSTTGLDLRGSFLVSRSAMPIGISFFTFQILSYVIDVYRGAVSVQRNPFYLGLYIMLFPQMIAGPIVRYSDVEQEIRHRESSPELVWDGMKRFMTGFSKKVLLANTMAAAADYAYARIGQSGALSWIGAVCYTLQIYYDFSGYSDMAIGMGRMAGFHFMENFNYPYISGSMKEFWRRWHISLSQWFRDYLYIPLGGNRRGTARTYLNLIIVFFVTGLWHGASFNFIVWGLFHGLFLCLERIGNGNWLKKIPAWIRHIYTLLVVIIGWVFFRADTLHDAVIVIRTMFSPAVWRWTAALPVINSERIFFFAASLLLVGGVPNALKTKRGFSAAYGACILLCFAIAVLYLIGMDFNPFIYFRF